MKLPLDATLGVVMLFPLLSTLTAFHPPAAKLTFTCPVPNAPVYRNRYVSDPTCTTGSVPVYAVKEPAPAPLSVTMLDDGVAPTDAPAGEARVASIQVPSTGVVNVGAVSGVHPAGDPAGQEVHAIPAWLSQPPSNVTLIGFVWPDSGWV